MGDDALWGLLVQHRALGPAPDAERAWLVAHGRRRSLAAGEVLTRKGELARSMNVVFSGRLTIHMDGGAGSHKLFEWRGGDVGGVLPFSRGARPPNDVVAEEPTDFLAVPREDLPELIRECPAVTATLVHEMLDRVRQFNAADLRDEKLVSLGRLAAGMAHELNNPASAAVRSATLLADNLGNAEAAAATMVAARLSDEQIAAINLVRDMCVASDEWQHVSPLARADRADAIADWLTRHGASDELAGALADTRLTLSALDTLAAQLRGAALDAALRWLATGCLMRSLASEIATAAARIHEVVHSVKGFTYMDRAPTPEPVDIRRGISDTLMVLGAKTRTRGASVTLELAPDLPRAHAVGAELNQVWMNLIDNALEAIEQGGHIDVTATRELDGVVVRITDDGAGIPPEIIGRIFDPFFTTKPVGAGTGMGLDIVRRILRRHEGEVDVESRPGHTSFRVMLPVER